MQCLRHFAVLAVAAGAIGCGNVQPPGAPVTPMNSIAERYVKLVLAVGQHDPAYVDAYYGPPEWKAEAEQRKMPLPDIDAEAAALIDATSRTSQASLVGSSVPDGEAGASARESELIRLRHDYLRRQLESLRARVRMLSGTKLTFDEESQALYDAVAPTNPESYFASTLKQLEGRLPGAGPLIQRYDAYRAAFVIPKDRLATVFDAALKECRARTARHIDLPAGESFTFEFVTNKSWSGYNWYQGNYRSLIQVNTDLPIYIDRAIDLACHEGYPGHHVYNALLEKHLMRDRGWVETSVYALFSPQSLIAEGTANYGIEVAFPGSERAAFERDVLFPAAGIDASGAEGYYAVHAIVERLAYAGNEAARRYLNGEIDRKAAADWLTRYALMSPARAEQRTRFMDEYRSYVINYNLGKDLVKRFIESRGGTDAQPGKRWEEFAALLGSPRLPSGLATQKEGR
jgi:hypothetical protein